MHAGVSVDMRAEEPLEKLVVTPTRVSGPTTAEWPDEETVDVGSSADAEAVVTPIVPMTVMMRVRSRHNAR